MRTLRFMAGLLALGLLSASASATTCYTTPRDWTAVPGGVVTAPQLNVDVRDNVTCLATEINTDGTITRNKRLFGLGTQVGNTGSGATDLAGYTFTLAAAPSADGLSVDYQTIDIKGEFITAANGNTKTLAISVAGVSKTIYSAAGNSVRVGFHVVIIRTGASTGNLVADNDSASNTGAMAASTRQHGAFGLTNSWGSTSVIKLVGTGTSTNDLITTHMTAILER